MKRKDLQHGQLVELEGRFNRGSIGIVLDPQTPYTYDGQWSRSIRVARYNLDGKQGVLVARLDQDTKWWKPGQKQALTWSPGVAQLRMILGPADIQDPVEYLHVHYTERKQAARAADKARRDAALTVVTKNAEIARRTAGARGQFFGALAFAPEVETSSVRGAWEDPSETKVTMTLATFEHLASLAVSLHEEVVEGQVNA